MKKKKVIQYILIVISFSSLLFLIFYNNSLRMTNKSVGAALTPIASDDTIIINAAKVMIKNNESKYDGKVEFTVKDLFNNNYLSRDAINPLSNTTYSENIRIIANVSNGKVLDIYVKNEPFKNVYSCNDMCYIENEYLVYENSLYNILKVDSDGYTYITNYKPVIIYKNEIDYRLKNIYNSSDKSLVKNVISISSSDLKSSLINKEQDLFVNTSLGYKLFDSALNDISDIDNIKSNLIPVIILRNDITYELGDGSQVNPYVVSK